VEGVAARTQQKISTGGGREPAPRAARRLSRTALLAAALALLLVVSALAVSGLRLGEIPEGFRLWLGLEDEPVPGVLHYDSVMYAESAWYADIDHVGQGEVYLSEGPSVRSKNLLTLFFSVWAVTPEQFESYVWRVQVDGQEDWLIAEPDTGNGGNGYYDSFGGWINLRLSLPLEQDDMEPRRITLCGGYESEDGRVLKVERAGILLFDPEAYSPTVPVSFGEGTPFTDGAMGGESQMSGPGVPFTNRTTGEIGYVMRADISGSSMLVYCQIDGSYALYDELYVQKGMEREEWLDKNRRLMDWIGSMGVAVGDITLHFADGTELELRPLLCSTSKFLPDDSIMGLIRFTKPIDVEALESITFGGKLHGQTFAINAP
jgi:hypothetical protein